MTNPGLFGEEVAAGDPAPGAQEPPAADRPVADLDFETAFDLLENVVARLEAPDVPLDEAVAAYEGGLALADRCQELLDAAQLRITELGAAGAGRPDLDRPGAES